MLRNHLIHLFCWYCFLVTRTKNKKQTSRNATVCVLRIVLIQNLWNAWFGIGTKVYARPFVAQNVKSTICCFLCSYLATLGKLLFDNYFWYIFLKIWLIIILYYDCILRIWKFSKASIQWVGKISLNQPEFGWPFFSRCQENRSSEFIIWRTQGPWYFSDLCTNELLVCTWALLQFLIEASRCIHIYRHTLTYMYAMSSMP